METGFYHKKPKFRPEDWEVDKFNFTLFDKDRFAYAGCGQNMLATICNKHNPFQIRELNQGKESCSDYFVLKYLRQNNFKYIKLTKCLLSDNKKEENLIYPKITDKMILVTSQLLKRNECSWFCSFSSYTIHNQAIIKIQPLDFLSYPIDTAYLIKPLNK